MQKVGGLRIGRAHKGQKVGGLRPAQPNILCRLCLIMCYLQSVNQSFNWSIYYKEERTIRTSNLDGVFSFSSLNRWAASFPLQQFRRRNQASELEWFWRVIWSPVPSLPPVVIILSHDVKNVTRWECQTGLSAGYRVIGWRIIIKQSSYKYLHQKYLQIR